MGVDEEGLILIVADNPDPHGALHPMEIVLELAPELRVGDVVDESGEALSVLDREPTPQCAQMGMVIRAIKEIGYTVFSGNNAEHSAHGGAPGLKS
jgi:hypothetical protein